jgi:hypothetical protein
VPEGAQPPLNDPSVIDGQQRSNSLAAYFIETVFIYNHNPNPSENVQKFGVLGALYRQGAK